MRAPASSAARLGLALSAAWMAVVALAFLGLEPSHTLQAAPLLRGLWGFLAAAAGLLACTGIGGALLQRSAPRALDDELGWLRALAVGLTAWGLLSLPLAAIFGVRPALGAALTLALATGWLMRPPVSLPRLSWPEGAVGFLFLLPGLLALLSPATDTDELYYHLALPARLLEQGTLLGGPWMANGSRPLALHLPWTWLLGMGGECAPRACHWLLTAGLVLAVRRRASAWWGPAAGLLAPLLLLGSTSFLAKAGLAYADLPSALLVFVAFDAALAGYCRGRGTPPPPDHAPRSPTPASSPTVRAPGSPRIPDPGTARLAGGELTGGLLPLVAVAAGGALAIKYTAAGALLPLFAWLLARAWRSGQRGPQLRAVLLAGVGAALLVLPWWLRNLLEGLHPLFPFAGWGPAGDFIFQFPEKYGLGRDVRAWLLLPWNVTMAARSDSFVFMGRLQPALLALAPAAFIAAWRCPRARAAALVSAGGALIWALGIQWLRYLLPVLPLMALAAAAGLAALPRGLRWLAWLVWLAGLPANTGPVLSAAVRDAPVALGQESRQDYLARELPGHSALRWLNEQTAADAQVALLFSWHAWPLERPWLLGSVEDHVPTRFFLQRAGDQALSQLKEQGITHVLTTRIHFIRKSYPFMDDSSFQRQFKDREEQLENLLERQAVLVFEEGRFAIWRL